MICESVRKKGSEERCENKCLKNLRFCGKHIKVKNKVLWTPKELEVISAIKIQKIWKGFSIRNYLKLSGIGSLKRSICINDEELVTLEPKETQSPFDFFSFEESGRVWWFSLESVAKVFSQTKVPLNPYTKVEISLEHRKRFRDLYSIAYFRNHLFVNTSIEEKINTICQIMEENLFPDLHPNIFNNITRINLLIFTTNLRNNMVIWESESKNKSSIRSAAVRILNSCIRSHNHINLNLFFLKFQCLSGIILIMKLFKNKYPICFMIASALYVM